MNKLRGTFLMALIGAGTVFVPAEKSEAGLIDWLRCLKHPCRSCEPAPACATPSCPPVVQEGSYCNPCSTPCASTSCATPCPVTYVRRSYMEPRTQMTTQSVLESRPTYVRRRYWDPCTRCYKTFYESATSYVRRSYCVPVTNYVERSYLEPVSCVTPSCPTGSCPISSPSNPGVPEPMPANGSVNSDRPGRNVLGSSEPTPASAPAARSQVPFFIPGRRNPQHTMGGA
jgi:hypothetical protein